MTHSGLSTSNIDKVIWSFESSYTKTEGLLILFEILLDRWYHYKHSENTKEGIARKKEQDREKKLAKRKAATQRKDIEE